MKNDLKNSFTIKKVEESFLRGKFLSLIIFAVIIGTLSSIGNYLFKLSIKFFQIHVFKKGEFFFESMGVPHLKVVLPAIGGVLLIPLIYFFKDEVWGYGFGKFLEKVNLKGGILRARLIIPKMLAAAITIGTGGSAGPESPIAQIGGAIGSVIGRITKVPTERLITYVACGAAGGIAATFNAPITGVFFALEIVLLGNFELLNFVPVVISSAMATAFTRIFFVREEALVLPTLHMVSIYEVFFYMVTGILCGLISPYFVRLFFGIRDLFDRITIPKMMKPALGGLIVGVMGYFFPQILGMKYEFMNKIFTGSPAITVLFMVFILKILATSITLGSGATGGVFAPILFIGAAMGGFMGKLFSIAFPHVTGDVGIYALTGMGAFISGAIHAPMTGIFLAYELSKNYQASIPIMFACVLAAYTAKLLGGEALDTADLSRRGIKLYEGREVNILRSIFVKDVMTSEYEPLREDMSLREVLEKIRESKHAYFPVFSLENEFIGIISLRDVREVLLLEEDLTSIIIARDIVNENIIVTYPDETLLDVLDKFSLKEIDEMPVVERSNPKNLLGMVRQRDVISAYNNAILSKSY